MLTHTLSNKLLIFENITCEFFHAVKLCWPYTCSRRGTDLCSLVYLHRRPTHDRRLILLTNTSNLCMLFFTGFYRYNNFVTLRQGPTKPVSSSSTTDATSKLTKDLSDISDGVYLRRYTSTDRSLRYTVTCMG